MKIHLRTYIYLTMSLLMLMQLQAQTGQAQSNVSTKNGSRLQMGQKQTTSTKKLTKPSSLLIYQNGLDRSINIKPSQAINSYYRTALFGTSTAATTSKENAAHKTASSETASNAVEIKGGNEIVRTEDKLFISDKISVNNVYPNPANDMAEIDYTITGTINEAKITLHNVLGTAIGDFTLDKSNRSIRIPTHEIPTGIYYYRLAVDGKIVATKKLLVRH